MKTTILARHIANACDRAAALIAVDRQDETTKATLALSLPYECRFLFWRWTVTRSKAEIDRALIPKIAAIKARFERQRIRCEVIGAIARHKRPDFLMEIEGQDLDDIALYLTPFADSEESRI